MIVYNLQCSDGHGFEAWFKDAKAYDSQRRGRKVACPVCDNTKIQKVPAAPRIAKGGGSSDGAMQGMAEDHSAAVMSALKELHRHVEENCDYVGDQFADEARKIHYGETEERGIFGEATQDEAQELSDEGVPFAALPKPPKEDA